MKPAFQHTTIILPVMNETYSLAQTMEITERLSGPDILEYIIVVCGKTTAESRAVIAQMQALYGNKVKLHEQKMKFLGGAIRECFDICKGSHVIMMASDLETNPEQVPEFIELSKKHPDYIITANRWTQKGGFSGYNPIKLVFNYVFQKFFSLLYGTNLNDMTYGYRIFPSHLVKEIQWEELRHPFLFETILKPLRLGVHVLEISSGWKARTEGESQNPFFNNFKYIKTGIKMRFMPINKIKKS